MSVPYPTGRTILPALLATLVLGFTQACGAGDREAEMTDLQGSPPNRSPQPPTGEAARSEALPPLLSAQQKGAVQAKSDSPAERRLLVSPLAGTWYEADPARLEAQLRGFLEAAGQAEAKPGAVPQEFTELRALVQPHAGYRYAGAVAAYGMRHLKGRRPERVIVLGPSHSVRMLNCASIPSATHLVTPLGEVPLDREFIDTLEDRPFFLSNPAAHAREHSVQIQVPFLQTVIGKFKLVPIVVGQIDPEMARTMADVLVGLIDDRTLVVASSDFTHYGPRYGYVPFQEHLEENLRDLDMGAFAAISRIDAAGFTDYIARTGATICGRDPIKILLEMFAPGAQAHKLAYDTSGHETGDFTNSVSYLSIALCGHWRRPQSLPSSLSRGDRRTLLELAHRTVRHVLEKNISPSADQLGIEIPETLREPRGVFVTLQEHGRLRGCIGQIVPGPPLFEAVIRMAANAALRDPRFPPVTLSEYPDLTFEISVLTVPQPVASPRDIVIGRHGIILRKGGRSAVYLPQVAPEQGWSLEETLDHLARKAGLPTSAWHDGASFMVFEAEVFGDDAGRKG